MIHTDSYQEYYSPQNSLLRALISARSEAVAQGNKMAKNLHSGISDAAGQLLGGIIKKHKIKSTLEVGFANGFSSLYILDALDQVGGGCLKSFDPFQISDWEGRGLERVKNAKFSSQHEFFESASWLSLPRMIEANHYFDFAFIDGSHSFDNAFVDFYLIDKLMKKDSVLAFDDVGWPGVERVVHYAIVNRDYKILAFLPRNHKNRRRFMKPIKQIANHIARTHRSPDKKSRSLIEKINQVSFLVLSKASDQVQEKPFKYF